MTLETKKTIGIIGSALAIMSVIAGIALMSMQIQRQGAGFFVGYLAYSMAILCGGLFIAWLPNMKNQKWGFRMVDGRLKWQKDERVSDIQRTRIVWWPFITLSLELHGLFDYCNDLWHKPWAETLMYVFIIITLVLLLSWAARLIIEDIRETKKNNGQM